ncbi:MAG: small GTP-binding protein, GTP-binding protein [Candidatus Peregrinibacteria bacterium GW2011_GWF2_43_17]|nr:MAG: small GTP-binding protein, GTP-binding protein [Candidatus Peregrinibacteria bacterium GW2011_GWF2_43_17]KKT19982.1 MAG: GTPase Der [Candidatus Peregrinibacteria bacterium GW2011_GWA2_43_8]HAU39650.1 ribosome biogenesis GTPase Der [Candidatus Peregrinibacteria bacterium]
MLPIVAIVGKPNTGKSTIFNKLLGVRRAIESKIAGTTRDKLMRKCEFGNYNVYLVDTGGISVGKVDNLEEDVRGQAKLAIEGADVILFVVDGQKPLSAEDFHVADILRKSSKSAILVANKCDNLDIESRIYNLYELGFGDAVPVSALHKMGLEHLQGCVEKDLKKLGFEEGEKDDFEKGSVRVSILGRPNVGKSSLLNAILGRKEAIVSDIPGTTRDSVEVYFKRGDDKFIFIDTAGLRKKGKVEQGIEKFSVLRSLRSIEESDVSVLVLDYLEDITSQDLHVASYILDRGKGLILVLNKVDLMNDPEEQKRHFIGRFRYEFDFLPWAPLVFVSAKNKTGVEPLLDVVLEAQKQRCRVIPEHELKIWLEEAVSAHELAAGVGKKKNKIMKIKQDTIKPPSFTLKVRYPDKVHFSYRRFLENKLREKFGFNGTAIRLRLH